MENRPLPTEREQREHRALVSKCESLAASVVDALDAKDGARAIEAIRGWFESRELVAPWGCAPLPWKSFAAKGAMRDAFLACDPAGLAGIAPDVLSLARACPAAAELLAAAVCSALWTVVASAKAGQDIELDFAHPREDSARALVALAPVLAIRMGHLPKPDDAHGGFEKVQAEVAGLVDACRGFGFSESISAISGRCDPLSGGFLTLAAEPLTLPARRWLAWMVDRQDPIFGSTCARWLSARAALDERELLARESGSAPPGRKPHL